MCVCVCLWGGSKTSLRIAATSCGFGPRSNKLFLEYGPPTHGGDRGPNSGYPRSASSVGQKGCEPILIVKSHMMPQQCHMLAWLEAATVDFVKIQNARMGHAKYGICFQTTLSVNYRKTTHSCHTWPQTGGQFIWRQSNIWPHPIFQHLWSNRITIIGFWSQSTGPPGFAHPCSNTCPTHTISNHGRPPWCGRHTLAVTYRHHLREECLPGARPARYLSINYPDFSPRFTL